MTQDVRKTLVVLSQIKTAIDVGFSERRAITMGLESPIVSGLFSKELIEGVIKDIEQGVELSVAMSKLDVFSEYDQTIMQATQYNGDLAKAFGGIIDQHMFIRSLGV